MRRIPLVVQLVAAIALGVLAGVLLGKRAEVLGELGVLVVRMLKALATPLVFFAVVDSFCRAEIPARQGAKLLGVCLVNAAVAGAVALGLSALVSPGAGVTLPAAPAAELPSAHGLSLDPLAALKGLVPESVLEPLLKNNVLSVVLLAVLAGIALRRMLGQGHGRSAAALVEDGFKLLVLLLGWVIHVVPFAVFGVVAKVVGTTGFGVFASLGKLVVTVALGLVIHVFGWYAFVAAAVARVSPVRFFRAAQGAMLTALGTGSSMATLPVTLKTLEEKLDVSHDNARLAACVGTNFNNDGIMLYEVVAALFVAEVHGIHLGMGDKISLCVTSALAAAGIAGVPEAGLITLSLVLTSVGLPIAGLPMLLTVDWLLGRMRAATNVSSDLLVATVLDRTSRRAR